MKIHLRVVWQNHWIIRCVIAAAMLWLVTPAWAQPEDGILQGHDGEQVTHAGPGLHSKANRNAKRTAGLAGA